ncbi:Uncharacterised protein [Sebaldella termitidis]|uniref:Uncharacterized protein n=1 Tax=Sebaldella termitidis (strain ATCC 33386 / NCTC 11300) TaxID=526218 RepID=D1AHT0_SEBTE|nr:hypothetical protein [Sebaldella termitidis]ACZ08314.1 hypothetical protein Sterm_1452 [Sebaldella termitidis ATCC 33386]SUI23623.1 Uncharacterised protein [Sebaldella termitidis]
MDILTIINKIAELGLLVVLSSVSVWNQINMYKRMNSDATNRDILEALKQFQKGHLMSAGLKIIVPYFIQGSRWKIENTLRDIINVNNISANYNDVKTKIALCYSKERNKLKNILEVSADNAYKYIIIKSVYDNLQINENAINSIFEDIKEETKENYHKYKEKIKLEMNQFEENAVSQVNDIL